MAAKQLCEVKTEDGDDCLHVATRHKTGSRNPPRFACEECVAALIDEGKIDHDVFEELPTNGR